MSNFIWETLFCKKLSSVLAPPPTFPPSPKVLDCAVSCLPSSCTPLDHCKCSFSPFRTQVPPRPDELEGWAHPFSPCAGLAFPHLTNNICAHLLIMSSRLSPPSFIIATSPHVLIGAYCNATSTASQHQQTMIAWLDRLQSSVHSPRPTGSSSNPFHLDTHAGKHVGQSDESEKEQGSQNLAQPLHVSSGLEGVPVSPNTLIDSEIDPYPDMPSPLGSLKPCDQLIERQRRCVVGQDAKDRQGECCCRRRWYHVSMFFLCGVTVREQD